MQSLAVCFSIFAIFILSVNGDVQDSLRSFTIDFDRNTFLKDGVPFRYISGTMHPYRVPQELWLDRLTKMWSAGLNAIETYVFWNQHEPLPGVYDFEEENDIFHFIALAKNIGFLVILRVGPYTCAERDYGALPWWLLSNGTDSILPRTNEYNYMYAVRRWLKVLLPKLSPLLYKNGGPIITVQIENEYGSYYACDNDYKTNLRDIFREYLGDDIVYFTTDGNDDSFLKCGVIPGVYPTIDFGPDANVTQSFMAQRRFASKGPLVNSEFYDGWLDLWGSPHSRVTTQNILSTFEEMMNVGVNVNFYMFHGGTNFGFSNGADPPFLVQPTSYDYDAAISEAGDTTDKYMAIRNSISKFSTLPNMPVPANSSKIGYGKIRLQNRVPLVDAILEMSDQSVQSKYPLSFEKLGQGYGFVMYTTDLSGYDLDHKVLSIPGIRDRGYVQIGSVSIGVVYRLDQTNLTIDLPGVKNSKLFIIVENMGRLNYGNDMLDAKGILSNVTLDGKILENWTTYLTENFVPNYRRKLNSSNDLISKYAISMRSLKSQNLNKQNLKVPSIFIGSFMAEADDYDTFLKTDKFSKGVALIQSSTYLTNLGRYWPHVGPQVTLYTPSVFLTKSSINYLILIEFESATSCQIPSNCYVEFIDHPILDSIKEF